LLELVNLYLLNSLQPVLGNIYDMNVTTSDSIT